MMFIQDRVKFEPISPFARVAHRHRDRFRTVALGSKRKETPGTEDLHQGLIKLFFTDLDGSLSNSCSLYSS